MTILVLGTIHKVIGFENLTKVLVKIGLPMFMWFFSTLICLYVVKKNSEVDTNE